MGRVFIKDDAEAVKWYRLAAEQDYANAQFNLGNMYVFRPLACRQDEDEVAVKWYRLAAEQDYANAQFNLGVRHTPTGIGVLKGRCRSRALVPAGRRTGSRQMPNSTSEYIVRQW